MKMTYMHITILAYFLTDTLNLQVLLGKEKYLLCTVVYMYVLILFMKN